MSPAVRFEEFGWRYEGKNEPALTDVTLEVREGEFIGVVGPNESGKTTLVSGINGLVPHHYHGEQRGSLEVLGENVSKVRASQLAREVGFVFSDPENQFTAITVEDEIVFGMENISLSLREIEGRLAWVSKLTGIEEHLDKSPFDISGGQKQRAAIASVIAMQPRILILDEPTSMLDPDGKDTIFDILARFKEELDLTVIVVEHDIERLAELADRLVLVRNGRVEAVATPENFFADPAVLSYGLHVPEVVEFFHRLRDEDLYERSVPLTPEEAELVFIRLYEEWGRSEHGTG